MSKFSSILLVLALLAATLPTSALAALPSDIDPSRYLNPDGTLNLPSDLNGSLDLTGWGVRLDKTHGVVFTRRQATGPAWVQVGTDSPVPVFDLQFDGATLYAGGSFGSAGGDGDANRIAMYDSGVWSSLGGPGTGLSFNVFTVVIDSGVLYAGGYFENAGGDPDADHIAMFSGGAWSSLGGAGTGLDGLVETIVFDSGVLYAGGDFENAGGDADADRIARFSLGVWSSLGGAGTGLDDIVSTIVFDGGVLYAGGAFTDAGGDADADRVAQFSLGAWSSLGGAGTGLNGRVEAIIFDSGVLYAGGAFTNAGGDANADRVAQYSLGAWSSLGGAGTGLNNSVLTLAFDSGVLYAGGIFTNAGGDGDADRIAQFSGGAWASFGPGTGVNNRVEDIVFDGGEMYIGGYFTNASGTGADGVARLGTATISSSGQAEDDGQKCSQEINSNGTTNLPCGRIYVSVPASAIPDGETNCRIVIKEVGESGDYGFALDDTVWDVKIICDSGEVNIFFSPITVCIRPKDGVVTNKSVFHNHGGGFVPISGGTGPTGYVCGSTQVLSLFTLGQFALPDTGFAPGEVTQLSAQPASSQYFEYDALTLDIPQLNVVMPIWGVPQSENGWDVSWLGENAGYLYGTTYPTWVGNSVLTAHVWNADNSAGPFYHLRDLQHGDQFYVHSGGQTFVYEVRSNRLVSENNLSVMKDSAYSLITLVTCESFNESSGEYLYRRAVQAVLVDVQ